MMTSRKHASLLAYSFATWLTFYLLGLPDYYQQYPDWVHVVLVIGVTGLYFPMGRLSLRMFWADGHHPANAWWLAFYLTVPLFLYDYLLLGIYQGLGIQFVVPYWYLTFFYFSFWAQIPYVARRMQSQAG